MKYLTVMIFISMLQNSALCVTPLALIYNGPGACPEDCITAAVNVAHKAGLQTQLVNSFEANPQIFSKASVWIQPGGMSSLVGIMMNVTLRQNLKSFIQRGGGYVGFCAGGFFASLEDPWRSNLAVFPGEAIFVTEFPDKPLMTSVSWKGKKRSVYWEGGPYFKVAKNSNFEAISYYENGSIAGVQGHYGMGKVIIVGYHPEAPAWWKKEIMLSQSELKHNHHIYTQDFDGSDDDIAIDMIKWATF